MTELDEIPIGPQRAPRGSERTCKTWAAEAALRMLMNNLDPEVAEDPEHLVVYGGSGKAARDWDCFRAIVAALSCRYEFWLNPRPLSWGPIFSAARSHTFFQSFNTSL